MSAATKTILNNALSLPDEEIGRRVQAYEKGEAITYSAEEVFEELRRT